MERMGGEVVRFKGKGVGESRSLSHSEGRCVRHFGYAQPILFGRATAREAATKEGNSEFENPESRR